MLDFLTALLKNAALNGNAWRPPEYGAADQVLDGDENTFAISGQFYGISANPFIAVDLGTSISVGKVVLKRYSKYIFLDWFYYL